MVTRLIQFALAQRAFILILSALLAGSGWYAFRHLPIDAFPDVASTQVKIILKAAGMTPEAIVEDFPELRQEHIRAALAFAAHREEAVRMITHVAA